MGHGIQAEGAWTPQTWRKIAIYATLWVSAGLAPLAYLLWWSSPHRVEPLAVPVSLSSGEFVSPSFTTDANDQYQIEIYFLPFNRLPLHLDWKIVDEHGKPIASGVYDEQQVGGNDAILGHYKGIPGVEQKVLMTIRQGTDSASDDLKLHVGIPERSLAAGYGFVPTVAWAILVGAVGVITLLVRPFGRHPRPLISQAK